MPKLLAAGFGGWLLGAKIHSGRATKKLKKVHQKEQKNLYTQYYGTVNLHNLLKFVSLRVHEGAQWEIQEIAKACLKIARQHFPHSVEAYAKKMNMEL